MHIAFRVDASIQMGTGHAMRCLTLAEALRSQGHECTFICRNHSGNLGTLIAERGFQLSLLSQADWGERNIDSEGDSALAHADWLGVTWQQDAEQTLEALNGPIIDWLVVDHYALDARWERRVSRRVKDVMVIDDIADRPHECKLLLDQNLGRKAEDYDGLVPETCIRLIGPHYALLRPEFAEFRERSLERRRTPELKRILITLGGVDRDNVTGQVLDVLSKSQLPPETELDVVMGASAPALDEVRRQAEVLPFRISVSVNVSDMAERMFLADLCIGAAGSTSWERCCLGLPTMTMVLAENQKDAAEAISRQGAAAVIQDNSDLKTAVQHVLADEQFAANLFAMSNAGASLVDGLGCVRVVNHLRTE
ncbi:UDP-2,4-diacetamido-2,4,6-trideoxy-beta-L-altropyranose hydrolase [Marinobacter sp. BW6]|uniref:UDP-2,4-diacetamido-2,4, 6-trideoxy-beta-L-altropyranose hydrolase n=1 Tax=Marinobacter sp. BW6 TaxID=2592624 RepID=UPI0011DEC8E4|nr:UDP-2,4-diacetamido-2,4,6-trideoxy-beta-L-altropyranose hydrolase [Marinobacter sp. BW6]TYC58037.1 UDP-2,4-diacetamido-2,4,6-trideoxy-beta-L-altropyranose hydrolase [Marinobacter sp. BW6]